MFHFIGSVTRTPDNAYQHVSDPPPSFRGARRRVVPRSLAAPGALRPPGAAAAATLGGGLGDQRRSPWILGADGFVGSRERFTKDGYNIPL